MSRLHRLAVTAFLIGVGIGGFCWFQVLFLWSAYEHGGI